VHIFTVPIDDSILTYFNQFKIVTTRKKEQTNNKKPIQVINHFNDHVENYYLHLEPRNFQKQNPCNQLGLFFFQSISETSFIFKIENYNLTPQAKEFSKQNPCNQLGLFFFKCFKKSLFLFINMSPFSWPFYLFYTYYVLKKAYFPLFNMSHFSI